MPTAGVSLMSPASLFATVARRSTRHASSTVASLTTCARGYAPARPGLSQLARRLAAPRAVSTVTAEIEPPEEEVAFQRGPASVHAVEGPLAVLSGVGADVPPGTLVRLGDAVQGFILSHREPKTFALMYAAGQGAGGAPSVGAGSGVAVSPGDAVEVLRKRHFRMPSDDDLRGRWIGALGQPMDGGDAPGGGDRDLACGEDLDGAIIRDPPGVEDRKPITTPLVTGIKALDVLTPLGRGQCMLLTGEPGTGLTRLGVGAIAAQAGSGVRCVYGATGAAAEDGGKGAVEELRAAGAMGHTTVVSVDGDASLAERYAATCAAFAVAEGARAKGEDVLLVLDDFTGLVEFTKDMARLSPQLDNPEGIIDEEKMVEYEGMIINALLAERRRFLGTTLQRVARMSDSLGGGSLTLLGIMYHEKGAYRGRKGSNKDSGAVGSSEGADGTLQLPAGFDQMAPEMQAKITAALEKKRDAAVKAAEAREAEAAAKRPEDAYTQPRSLVEEFMSITDGQVMVENFSESNGWGISVKDSVSRIGTPGAAGPLKSLDMMQLRLDVMQADDMQAFGNNGDEKVQMRNRSSAIRGVLRQRPGETAALSAQTVGLFALQKGYLKNMNADEAAARVNEAVNKAKDTIPEVMDALDANPSKALSAEHSEKLASLFAA